MRDLSFRFPGNGDGISRRQVIRLLGWCAAACGIPARAATATDETLEIDRLWDREGSHGGPEKIAERSYRVDATILIASFPLLRRNGVGDARAALRQPAQESGADARMALEFAAASDPARAHGLDRMGWIREVVVEKSGAPQRAGVLGIMSDSTEQTAEEAKQALHGDPGAGRLVAIDSCHANDDERHTRSRVIRFRAPRGNWTGGDGLPELARTSFRGCPAEWKEAKWPGGQTAPATFLYGLKRAMEQGGSRRSEYIWNQNRYTMHLEREADAAASREFSAPVDRVRGELTNITQGLHPLRFQLWIDREAAVPMPLRVEFQPRSFLRLTLEAVNNNTRNTSRDTPRKN